ncbi:MAG: hypothetical protein ABIQ18_16830, partial [Umezawaea sp.]
ATLGVPQPLPEEVALDGVDEFLVTCCATTEAWPHEPAVIDYHVTEGRSWRLWLDADGARPSRLLTPATGEDPADFSTRSTASELVLAMYGRGPVDSLKPEGDLRVYDRIVAWEPG